MKSFEIPSPSEFDRKFFGEQSLLSALSVEQLSTSRTSNDEVCDGSDARLSILASLCPSVDTLSPLLTSTMNPMSFSLLAVSLQGKSSTPHLPLQNRKPCYSFDEFYSDVMASHISWDFSVVTPENNSPKTCMELSALKSVWSPNTQVTQSVISPRFNMEDE